MKVLCKNLKRMGFAVNVSQESPFTQRYFLTRGDAVVAHMKFCSYLGDYYDFASNGFEEEQKYTDLAEKTEGLVGIVEVQARRATTELRQNVPYKDILFRAYQHNTQSKPDFILSHRVLFYTSQVVTDYLKKEGVTLDKERLLKNYDRFATSQGYQLDSELDIFRRPTQ